MARSNQESSSTGPQVAYRAVSSKAGFSQPWVVRGLLVAAMTLYIVVLSKETGTNVLLMNSQMAGKLYTISSMTDTPEHVAKKWPPAARNLPSGDRPTKACGWDYMELVEGGPDRAHEPYCSIDDLRERPANATRATQESPFVIPGCRLYSFSNTEVCDLFETLDLQLITIGDSLVRHATQAMAAVMDGDYVRGGTRHWEESEELLEKCQCDKKFEDRGEGEVCRWESLAYYKKGDEKKICPQWTKPRLLFKDWLYPQQLNITEMQDTMQEITSGHTRTFIYLSAGLWLNMNFHVLWNGFVTPLSRLMSESVQPVAPHLLIGLLPYPGEKKDVEKYVSQAREGVIGYNAQIKERMAELGNQSTLIYYNTLSDNSLSADGTHFQQDTNTILAQMIFNTIAGLSGEEAPYLMDQAMRGPVTRLRRPSQAELTKQARERNL